MLRATEIGKRYGECVSLVGASLELRAGEVHALVGENGAGKTTLLKIVYGLERPDTGTVTLDGQPLPGGVRAAQTGGVRMVQQHFSLVPEMTALENILIGQPRLPAVLDLKAARARLARLSADYGLAVDGERPVRELSIGERQRTEILRALWEPGRVLLRDEPTAVLAPREVEHLFGVLDRLRKAGLAICIVTHKVGEMKAIADRLTVLHRGKNAGLFLPDADARAIAAAIVGGAPPPPLEIGASQPGEPRLAIDGVVVRGARGERAIDGVTLTVRAGEIVGVAGVEGNGQTELGLWLAGLVPRQQGALAIDGAPHARDEVAPRRAAGVAYIPEDRHRFGLLPESSLAELLYLHGRQSRAQSREATRSILEAFDVTPRDPDAIAGALSGGNQQKVVVGRALADAPLVLVAAQPTRGVDLGAQRRIHQALVERRDAGGAILLLSADLDELLALASRIVVLYRGKIVKQLDNSPDADRDALRATIGNAMIGAA